jgi:hypothetical protein
MAELSNDCCSPTAQADCCDASEKAGCCGESHSAGGCGCAAGEGSSVEAVPPRDATPGA